MKIRNGFVSNSSSSSFIIIADSKVFEKKLSEAKTHIQLAVRPYMFKRELSGKSIAVAHGTVSSEDDSLLDYFDEDEVPQGDYGPMTTEEALREFFDLFGEDEAIIKWECC